MSALLYACQSNRKDIAALLLEYEADWSVTCVSKKKRKEKKRKKK